MRERNGSPLRQSAVIGVVAALTVFVATIQGAGLPGEYVLSNRWRAMLAPYTAQPNPALLTEADYVSVRGALSRTLSEFNMLELGVTVPVGLYQSVGVTWFTLGTASYSATQDFAAMAEQVNANHNYFVFSYAVNMWRTLSVGININLAQENLFGDENRVGIGADLGLTYRLIRHPLLGEHMAGVALSNLIPPNMGSSTGSDSIGIIPDEKQAASLNVSLFSKYWEKRIESVIAFSLRDLYSTGSDFQATGVNAAKTMEWTLDAQLNLWILRIGILSGLIGFDPNGFGYAGFALGFNLPSVNAGRDLSFMYQMVGVGEGEATSHTLYLRGDIGRHREELYAKRMARLLNLEPNDLYNRALSLYVAGRYFDAYFVFGRIVTEYPDFFKRDWVTYYMASCLEHLDMRRASSNDYVSAIREYPKSAMLPYADLGLMRLYYREADYSSVTTQLNRLNVPEVPDSIKYHALYIMGETSMKTGEYRKAKQVFEMIPATHPEYLFAQHSLAVANVLAGTEDLALENLRTVVNSSPRGEAQQEIINRSLVMLGYMFYENGGNEGALSQAVTALRTVPRSSYYFEDAQMGLGWTAIRARQWQDCIEAGQNLMTGSARLPLRAEGALLKAYAFMMLKDYVNAASVLAEANTWLEQFAAPTQEDLQSRTGQYEGVRVDYDDIAREAQQLATSRVSEHVTNLINALSSRQQVTKDTVDSQLRYFDEYVRNSFFARAVSKVREDVEYALAVANKLSGVRDVADKAKQVQEKQKSIDDEIIKLKEQMEKLDNAAPDSGAGK